MVLLLLLHCLSTFTQWTKIYVVQNKKEGKDQESIQSSTTPDLGYQWESDNFTIRLTCMVTFIRGNPLVNKSQKAVTCFCYKIH